MKRLLISWIGQHDLNARESGQLGPVLAAVMDAQQKQTAYDELHLLCNYPERAGKGYTEWLSSYLNHGEKLTFRHIPLSSPTAYAEIYPAIFDVLEDIYDMHPEAQKFVHLSPGTPAMTSIWILLTKTRFPAVCIESWLDRASNQQHVKQACLPFSIQSEFLLSAADASDKRLQSSALVRDFEHITSTSPIMAKLLEKSVRIASRNVPTLILGETGTGKEVFAKLIHEHSTKRHGPFVPVNCGALPAELAESLLFGHVKGAFTGASSSHDGFFKAADKGTLFLDEIGELSPMLQTKLLRVLQEKEFTPVGANKVVKSDFRLICATHRNLPDMIETGDFREDLFYRIAIGILKIPPLRDRGQDIAYLAIKLFNEINDELADQPIYQEKRLTECAITWINDQRWPGNVRELRATLLRAAAWSDKSEIDSEDLAENVLERREKPDNLMPSSIGQGKDIQKTVSRVVEHHISLALEETRYNKAAAARLLGLNSPQVLNNWISKHCPNLSLSSDIKR